MWRGIGEPRSARSSSLYDGVTVATLIPAEGALLGRILDTEHEALSEGLSRPAYAKFDAALLKTAWGSHHRRRLALVKGGELLASGTQYDLAAVVDQRPVRVCGIGSVVSEPAHRDGGHEEALIERVIEQAERDGAAMGCCFGTCAPSTGGQPASTWCQRPRLNSAWRNRRAMAHP